MLVQFSDKDILASTIVEPGWYLVLIEEVEDKASNDGKSINSWLKGKILKNDDNGDEKFAGVPTPFPWLINSKGAWASVGLFNSAFGDEIKGGERRDTTALAGKKLVMFIGNGYYQDQLKNVSNNQYRRPKEADLS